MRTILCLALCLLSALSSHAQELRAEVRLSTEALGVTDRHRYAELERQIASLLNETRWTDLQYAAGERIACSFALKLLSVEEDRRFHAELVVTASRPVYNTSYTTTSYVYRDPDFTFELASGETFEYNPQQITSQLVAVLALHAQYIIAMDLDSFSPLGGSRLTPQLSQLIANAATQPDWEGWRAIGLERNRASLASALADGAQESMRMIWYRYHRLALDTMETQLPVARAQLLVLLGELAEYQTAQPYSPYLPLFATAKVDELVNIFAEADADHKRSALELLRRLFPTASDSWGRLSR